ncbi:hypothetical protein M0Q97_13790 [Candidatus Dojkabacteria bacterium]|jgi:hypothetical protein|nr:hypothetical protein [Candidatus Dojkabacteria bacterium]
MKDEVLFAVKTRHIFYVLLIIIFIVACSSKGNYKPVTIYATEYDFSKHIGKTVENINYCDGCGAAGDDLVITFTDGSMLKVCAYKYDMEVYLNNN